MVEEHASISTLPPEMIEKILRNVNPNDIGKMQQLDLCEDACDLDVLALVSRTPQCDWIEIDPCFTIDNVSSLLRCMKQITTLKYKHSSYKDGSAPPLAKLRLISQILLLNDHRLVFRVQKCNNTIIADDSTIDVLIPLSQAGRGLGTFWVDAISTDFTLTKMFELFEVNDLTVQKCNNTIIADDSTIDVLIPLSQAGRGLGTFWVDAISTDFTLTKMFELFEKGKFRDIFTFFVEKVHGSDEQFNRWLLSNAQRVDITNPLVYRFLYRDVDFIVQIGYYAP
ncbi:hypothetical protein OESDEN_03877 [Oesophagostomum dentatum]|uniref:F-box domain-containing protein n=1 Tax=Oesophagostomum dentatum TaxID=61180 RepID=A0A0B1TJC3_OESDE|nr:hypothetical protein OESDEN_03877 [Oesophagostomum dentatum]